MSRETASGTLEVRMYDVFGGCQQFYAPSFSNFNTGCFNTGINQSVNFLLGPTCSPYGSFGFGMMDFTSMFLTQMMTNFLYQGFQSGPPCGCHQHTHLYEPYLDMPYGPRPSQGHSHVHVENHPGCFPQEQAQHPAQLSAPSRNPVHPKTRTKSYDPTKDAAELNKAMEGGMFGLGTDEEAIMKTLRGKSKDEIELLKQNYKDHYGKDLTSQLRGELNDKEFAQASNLMKGETSKADARKLQEATTGLTDDESAVFETLRGKSKEEREELLSEYRKLTGKDLSTTLKGRFSEKEFQQAEALINGDTAKADAAKLNQALTGLTDDEDAVYQTLEGRSEEEIAAIKKEYKALTGRDLESRMKSRLTKTENQRATSLLEGDQASADAARIHQAVKGMGTDEDSIYETLEGKSKEERDAIAAAYKKQYGVDLDTRLSEDMSGNDFEKANTLLEDGKTSDVQKLRFAMEGMGTDEEAVQKVLAGKSKEEVAQLKEDYKAATGRDLDSVLDSELGGRDLFDANQALKGKPQSIEEALERLNERHAFERKGEANEVSTAFMDLINDKGELLDRNVGRANDQYQAYQLALQEGRYQDAEVEKARLGQLLGYSNLDVEGYQESKDAAADTAGTVAATAAAVAVMVGTAGTATPLVATALYAGGAGALARTATTSMISGAGYDEQNIGADMASGFVDGAATVAGAGAGKVASGAIKGTSRGARLAAATVQGSVDGLVGGAAGGAAAEAFRDGTWDDGFGEGLTRVGKAGATGAVAGTVAGGGTVLVGKGAGATARFGKRVVSETYEAGSKAFRNFSNAGKSTSVQRFGSFASDSANRGGNWGSGWDGSGWRDAGRKAWDDASSWGKKAWDDTKKAWGDANEWSKKAWDDANDWSKKAWDDANWSGNGADDGWGQWGRNSQGAGDAFTNAGNQPRDIFKDFNRNVYGNYDYDVNWDFEILGLDPNASRADLVKKYRKLAIEHHPDRGGQKEMFQAVNHANQNLKKYFEAQAS